MKTSGTLADKRGRASVDVAEILEEPAGNQEARGRVGDFYLAFFAGEEEAEEHAQWRSPDLSARRSATHASALEGAGATISA